MSAGQKRQFPYYSTVPSLDVKRRGIEGLRPGQAHAEPAVHSFPDLNQELSSTATDFTAWPVTRIRAFLDQRGEDHDDCKTFADLVQRARKCEYETGAAPADSAAPVEEADPLDAFMAEINQDLKADKPQQQPKPAQNLELDEEDHVADYMEARRQNKASAAAAAYAASGKGTADNEDDEVYAVAEAVDGLGEVDEEDLTALAADRKRIEPLPALDHANLEYDSFGKDFYEEAAAIAQMSPAEVNSMRRQLGVRVTGFDPPKPVQSFAQLGFDAPLLATVKRAGFEKPTAIQAQAMPAILCGRDVLGIAKTGSGKTAAFVLPMLVHIMDQPELDKGEGPIGLIVAPTRELSEQIHKEARRFSKPYNLRVAAAFGGLSKYEQFKDLKGGSEVAVCTPGRMIDLLKMKACNMLRTTYLVFDEADRMFDMGFEPQVRSVLGQIRPDRQTALFSATMPTKVERLVRDALTSPVRVTVGELGVANEDIRQVAEVVEEGAKLQWLTDHLPSFVDQGDVLVFAAQKLRVDELTNKLKAGGFRAAAIHGDMDQHSRMAVLHAFKASTHHVLVATDVAARGLDIRSIKSVVNYDAAKDIDTHVHRVGRTGRAGDKEGTAYTLLTSKEARFAGDLIESMTSANQEVQPALLSLAKKDPRFKKGLSRGMRGGMGGGRGRGSRQVGGAGLGFGPAGAPPAPGFAKAVQPASDGSRASNFEASFAKGGYESTVSTGSGAAEPVAAPVPTLPTPPTTPAAAAPVPPPAQQPPWAAQQQQQQHSQPQPQPSGQQQQQQQQGVWGGSTARNAFGNRYKTAFVASGTSGGDIGQGPTIVAARQQSNRAMPPPPTPVTARAPPTPAAAAGSAQALAAAQAIAARLSASMGGSSTPTPPSAHQYPPTAHTPSIPGSFAPPASQSAPSRPALHPFAPPPSLTGGSTVPQSARPPGGAALQSSIAAAQAVANRLAAQHGAGQSSSSAILHPFAPPPSLTTPSTPFAPPASYGAASTGANRPPQQHVGSGMARGSAGSAPRAPGGMQLGSSRRMWDDVEAERDRERGSEHRSRSSASKFS